MISIGLIHYLYLFGGFTILISMFFRKDIIVPCILFIFLIGAFSTKSLLGGFIGMNNSLIFSISKLSSIILTIALVTSLSKLLSDIGSDYLMIKPLTNIMKEYRSTYWILGLTLFVGSLFLWPSPAVALIGIILLPVAINAGLTPMGAAISMSIFGFGIALSSDFIIQGAPKITAEAAGISSDSITISSSPLFILMGVVTSLVSYFMLKKNGGISINVTKEPLNIKKVSPTGKLIAIITPLAFSIDVVIMYIFKLKGSEATSVITGTAIIILIIGAILEYKLASLERVTEYVREGLVFAIRIFAPIIIISAFFFLGGNESNQILGINISDNGLLSDWAILLSNSVPVNKYFVVFIQMLIGGLSGIDGSGFSGLPLVGSLAATFGSSLNINTPVLASVGQITAIWVGGGVITPWSVISCAAICGVDSIELARKNMLPVMIGFLATFILACFMV
jgi:hypothetical protein